MDSMTARVSCFARAYHTEACTTRVFSDPAARALLGEDAYRMISVSMVQGKQFFLPGFTGTDEEALRVIVDKQLAPSVLGRSAFCEERLAEAGRKGCRQYVLFAAGLDTFSYREEAEGMRVFELDREEVLAEKKAGAERAGLRTVGETSLVACELADEVWPARLTEAGFRADRPAFGSLLGLSYYLKPEAFDVLLGRIADLFCPGSLLCFDYPQAKPGEEAGRNEKLAAGAGEAMQARYPTEALRAMLKRRDLEVIEHMDAEEMTERFFAEYNRAQPGHAMCAPEGVGYVLCRRV